MHERFQGVRKQREVLVTEHGVVFENQDGAVLLGVVAGGGLAMLAMQRVV